MIRLSGRPRRYDEAATHRVTVRVTPTQRVALGQVAHENRSNVSGIIREAVNEFVADYRDGSVFRRTKPR